MQTDAKATVLFPAFMWDCDNCGTENFQRSVIPSFSEDELSEMRLEHGIDPLQEGMFLTAPKSVVCGQCGESFKSVYFGDEPEVEDAD